MLRPPEGFIHLINSYHNRLMKHSSPVEDPDIIGEGEGFKPRRRQQWLTVVKNLISLILNRYFISGNIALYVLILDCIILLNLFERL